MRRFRRESNPVLTLLAGFLMLCGHNSVQGLSLDEQRAYALRFSPYIATTAWENIRPCNWQWFIGRSTLVWGYTPYQNDGWCCPPVAGCQGIGDPWTNGAPLLYASDMSNNPVRLIQGFPRSVSPDNGGIDMGFALHLDNGSYHSGEDWTDVVYNGHGIYAHAEEVPGTQIINIEYTVFWAYNSATCNYHNGDMTTLIVDYDRGCDLITRVTYSAHGSIIQSYRLSARGMGVVPLQFQGFDLNGNFTTTPAATAHWITNAYSACSDNAFDFTSSTPDVFLVMDPVSLRYEHPVVCAELNSHEFWPTADGKLCFSVVGLDLGCGNSHAGNGVAFLVTNLQVLGTLTNIAPGQEPFLLFNGKMGTDPQSIIHHRTWFWPEGRTNNPYGITNRWTDDDPYITRGNLPWPPAPEYTNGPVTMYVDWRNTNAPFNRYYGSADSPFPDLKLALSFLPARGTVSVAAGTYSGPYDLSRQCTIVATGGTVTLTGPQ